MSINDDISENTKARIAGGLWLAVIVTGIYATLVSRALYVRDNPAATAANLLASEDSFRAAFAVNIASFACYVGVTGLMYLLLAPVNRTLALVSALFGIAGTAIGMATSVAQLLPLALLKGTYLTSFTAEQLQSLALTAFSVDAQGTLVSWIFFGSQCVMISYLVVQSGFLPRSLGVLLALGGSSYVIGCLLILVSPSLGGRLFPILGGIAFLGEGSLSVWLLFKGVRRSEVPGEADSSTSRFALRSE